MRRRKLLVLKGAGSRMLFSGCALALSLSVAAKDCVATNLIANASFELPAFDSPKNWELFSGISGWTLPTNYIEIQETGLYGAWTMAGHGDQWVEIDQLGAINLTQTVNTIIGATYQLSFLYAARPDAGVQQLGAYLNNNLIGTAGGVGNGSDKLDWNLYSFNFTANSLSTVLGFGALQALNIGAGNLLDLVSLELRSLPPAPPGGGEPVPEPATMLLLSVALGGIGIKRRKLSH